MLEKREPSVRAGCSKVLDAIRAGDLDAAQAMFVLALHVYRSQHDLVMDLAELTEPGPGLITLGTGARLYGNPFREGFAWRCGQCLDDSRNGGPDPKSGVNYTALRDASNDARKHAAKDHTGSVRVTEVTR